MPKHKMVLTVIPCYRACAAFKSGEFLSEDCLSSATSHVLCGLLGRVPQRPTFECGAGHNIKVVAVGGSLFFALFLLAKQKKETRQSRESD